jgi:hypothetical protein
MFTEKSTKFKCSRILKIENIGKDLWGNLYNIVLTSGNNIKLHEKDTIFSFQTANALKGDFTPLELKKGDLIIE